MISWVIRLILLAVIIRIIWRFLSGLIDGLTPEPARSRRGGGPAAASVPLVRDPVCGTHVVRTRALTAGTGDRTQYFCSEKCRQEYLRRP